MNAPDPVMDANAAVRLPAAMTPPALQACKGSRKIICLTAYTAPMARLLDPHVDLLLVGDSVGMVLYGMRDTLSVTMDMIIAHGRAVAGQCRRACVVVDMPFASYQESEQLAFRNAARILAETGCQAVKLEGGREMAATVAYLTARGIPVMGHVGLLPQSVRHTGRFKIRGKCLREAALITADARAIHEAGALAVVVEGVHEPLAARISTDLPVPTIGIGASPACDGQILVTEDMLGLNGGNLPRFVKQYGDLADQISALVEDYAADIREVRFPESGHCYG